MVTTSSFIAIVPSLVVPLVSRLRSWVVLIAASLGCVRDDGTAFAAASYQGATLVVPSVCALRRPGEAVHAANDAAATGGTRNTLLADDPLRSRISIRLPPSSCSRRILDQRDR
jgi:hypothetical protein